MSISVHRRLSPYWNTILRRGTTSSLKEAFARLGPPELFNVALSSTLNCEKVRLYCRGLKHEGLFSDLGLFARFPMELMMKIVREMSIADKVKFARTCRQLHQQAAFRLDHNLAGLLREYSLHPDDVSLLLLGTPSLITGSAVTRLIYPERRFTFNTLDFYTSLTSTRATIHYLGLVGDYSLEGDAENYDGYTIYRLNNGRSSIRVIEWVSGALAGAMYSLTSADYGYVDGEGLKHAYPGHLDADITISTPRQFVIPETKMGHRTVWKIIRKYEDRGFTWAMDYTTPHNCGLDKSCPASLRASDDSGCMYLRLPVSPLGKGLANGRVTWSLFGSGCRQRGERTATEIEDTDWVATMDGLMASEHIPRKYVQYA